MNANQSIGNECSKRKEACHGMPPPPVVWWRGLGLASASVGEAVVVVASSK